MDYIVRAFERSTNWDRDNSYANITATSKTLLNFDIPTSFKFQTSNQSTKYTFNTLELTTRKKINGSLTYLSTDAENIDKFVNNSYTIPLQEATETYRNIRPGFIKQSSRGPEQPFQPKSLYYGRIYYPNSALEAMLIKRISSHTQVTVRCISNIYSNLNIVTCYWQRDKGRNFQELIYSSNDSLCGYRILHNFSSTPSKFNNSLYNNSSLSLGGEVWLGCASLTPGCSTSLRYCTHSANTGRPLTLTFSWNPLFGHISSTYSAKTSSNSTFSAKYDFNMYSIESGLSFGCELWKTGEQTKPKIVQSSTQLYPIATLPKITEESNIDDKVIPTTETEQRLLDDLSYTFSSSLRKLDQEKSIIENFEKNFNEKPFTNVWKISTSIRDRNLKLLWEGKFKGFLISAGTELFYSKNKAIDSTQATLGGMLTKFGINIQYSS